MPPAGAQAGIWEPGSFIPSGRTLSKTAAQPPYKEMKTLPTWKTRSSKLAVRKAPEMTGKKAPLRSGWCQDGSCIPGWLGVLGVWGGAAGASPAQSLRVLAGWNFSRCPSSFETRQSLFCSSSGHPRRVTVGPQTPRDGPLTPAPLPGQMLGWVVIFGAGGILVLNKLEGVSFFHDEQPLFVVGIAAPTYLYYQIVFFFSFPPRPPPLPILVMCPEWNKENISKRNNLHLSFYKYPSLAQNHPSLSTTSLY